jgi:hypothetical protein
VTAAAVAGQAPEPWFPSSSSNLQWAQVATVAPQLVSTMRRYLVQLTTFLAPRSVEVADQTLRQFARWLTTCTVIGVVADIERRHIEDYDATSRTTRCGSPPSPEPRHRCLRRTPSGTDCG